MENLNLGEHTKKAVNIADIEGIAKPELSGEVKKRVENIRIDAVLKSGRVVILVDNMPFDISPS